MKRHVMRPVFWGWMLAFGVWMCVPGDAQAPDKSILLFDFEEDTQEWKLDWESQDADPQVSVAQAHHGKKSISYAHHFKPDQKAVGCVVTLRDPKDCSAFGELRGWIYIPEHNEWQAQMYVRSGDDWTLSWGRLQEGLKHGWHQVEIKISSITNPTQVKDIGIQLKNWDLEGDVTFYVDQVEAVER